MTTSWSFAALSNIGNAIGSWLKSQSISTKWS